MRARLALVVALAVMPATLAAAESLITVRVSGPEGDPPAAGETVDIRVSIRDPATGAPLAGFQPALWLVPITGPEAETTRCEVWVSRLLNTPVAPAGAVDLNGFDLVQATDDGRLALVDPQLNLASANIKAIASLGSVPDAWAIDAGGRQLWVALGAARTVAMLTLDPFAVATRHELSSPPSAIAVSGQTFWVGTAGGDVLRIDRDAAPVLVGSVGRGRVMLDSADADGLFAIAENGGGAFISGLGLSARFAAGAPIRDAAFAPLADTLYTLDRSGSRMIAIARDSPGSTTNLALSRRAAALASSPDGRWLALTAETGQSVTIYDTATNRERWTVAATDPVIDAVFSDAFLYLAHRKQGGVTRVVFDPDGGPPGVAAIAAGARGDAPQHGSHLPLVALIPKAGILVASTRDRTAYMVSEDGMQAAMSSLPLRAGTPAGILLRYRGLTPGANEGEYTARAVPKHGGPYYAVVRIDRPNLAHCARVDIAGTPDPAIAAWRAAPNTPPVTLNVVKVRPGDRQLRFSLTGQNAGDLTVSRAVLAASDGNWRRMLAKVKRAGDDFVAPITVDHAGPLRLYVEYHDSGGAPRTIAAPVPLQEEAGI